MRARTSKPRSRNSARTRAASHSTPRWMMCASPAYSSTPIRCASSPKRTARSVSKSPNWGRRAMPPVEFREYSGDFEDIVDLAARVWMPEYGGRIWFPLPEPAFLRAKLAPQTGAQCPVAYDGMRLVANVVSVPRVLRVHGKLHQVSMYTGYS